MALSGLSNRCETSADLHGAPSRATHSHAAACLLLVLPSRQRLARRRATPPAARTPPTGRGPLPAGDDLGVHTERGDSDASCGAPRSDKRQWSLVRPVCGAALFTRPLGRRSLLQVGPCSRGYAPPREAALGNAGPRLVAIGGNVGARLSDRHRRPSPDSMRSTDDTQTQCVRQVELVRTPCCGVSARCPPSIPMPRRASS